MTLLEQLGDIATRGVDLIEEAYAAADLPLPADQARELRRTAEAFLAPTSHARYQRRALAAARRNQHSLTTLALIARRSQRVKNPTERWRFRETLCSTAGNTADISRVATRLLRDIAPPPEREDGGRRILHGEKTTLSFTGPAAQMADIWATAKDDPLAWLTGSRAVAPARVSTNVIIELPDYLKILRGEGSEVRLAMTNGATITGADLIRRTLASAGFFTLIHPAEGPVNLYRARHASAKQRRMLEAEGARCAWPACRRPADECQAHHIFEYVRGGHTHPANMCLLCPYHNAINGLPGRGRMARINGRVAWLPPNPRHADQPTGPLNSGAPPNSGPQPHSAPQPKSDAPPPVFTGRAPRGPTAAVP
ncbi:HNH endonuclease [Corynebacterium macginleyi]|uniref:HNH endonuclease n=1 Tax=Corynebacterium macginleyi TaxID=38290 RepID=A0A3M0GHD9_9CORY|nr:HNH endonuclease signature motif containing protein [Corynebacterium macginleyi]MBK4139895.1 HNH endonuclease [Corynebacterium macginleyi]MBK4151884.1 HNH endonuclease [Corynebacterium macginleyi]MBK4156315.1 HNH endonuclease [Corynebacterium macginleyi]RMB63688.1 HNH endonuclease [Corynebacterium macginleyi]